MRTVGIIGGLGPETTAEFYLRLVFDAQERYLGVTRPPILISSVPLPYALEQEVLEQGKHLESCLPYIIDAAQSLEASGAEFIVMPCNTLHVFIDQLRASVQIPVLSIVEETVAYLKKRKVRKIAFVGTELTVQSGLYTQPFGQAGISPSIPTVHQQKEISRIIYRLVAKRHDLNDRHELVALVEELAEGVEDVVLACTDLQIIMPNHPNLHIHDTMLILAEAVLREMMVEKVSREG